MTGRRDFLKAAGGAGALRARLPSRGTVREAGEILQRGELGRVVFCRVEHAGFTPSALEILDRGRSGCAIEIEAGAEGAAFLGERATLVVDQRGCQVFGDEWEIKRQKAKVIRQK